MVRNHDVTTADPTDYVVLLINTGTADAVSDFVFVADASIFPIDSVNDDTQCFDITIVDDEVLEADETIIVQLLVITADTILGNNITTVTIADDG